MDIETPKPSNGAASESFLRTAVNSVSESSSPGGKHQASDPIVLMSFHRSTISGVANGRRPSLREHRALVLGDAWRRVQSAFSSH
jgi:hypothetical protein